MVKGKGDDEASAIWCSCPDACRDIERDQSACASRTGVWLRHDLFSADAMERFVAHNSAGAIATFAGATRDRDGDAEVDHLHYEAYAALVMRQLRAICDEIRKQWAVARIAIQHRIGECGVGQVSVRITVSSTHRAEALAAVAFAINQLKAQAAIFKREHYVDRAAEWKANRPLQKSGKASSPEIDKSNPFDA